MKKSVVSLMVLIMTMFVSPLSASSEVQSEPAKKSTMGIGISAGKGHTFQRTKLTQDESLWQASLALFPDKMNSYFTLGAKVFDKTVNNSTFQYSKPKLILKSYYNFSSFINFMELNEKMSLNAIVGAGLANFEENANGKITQRDSEMGLNIGLDVRFKINKNFGFTIDGEYIRFESSIGMMVGTINLQLAI